ncbi:MAG: ATP-binding protein [Acetobacter sp.]|nr:ATP-binding protein [Acetobacter sp.]
MEQTIILMSGIPASGKSTYIRAAMKKDTVPAVRVSRDDIRKALVGEDVNTSSYFSMEDEVFDNFVRLVNEAVTDGVGRIYVDATHINPASRRKILSRINKRESLNLEVVVLDCAVEVAQARNLNRAGFAQVPRRAIYNMAHSYTVPTKEELSIFNFKEVNIIKGE